MKPTPQAPQATKKKAAVAGHLASFRSSTEIIHKPVVIVDLVVPARIAAALPKRDGYYWINAASVGPEMSDITRRVEQWNSPHRVGISGSCPAGKKALPTVLAELHSSPCETITLKFAPDHWTSALTLCERLKVTAGDWLLCAAAYNANLVENPPQRASLKEAENFLEALSGGVA
ncbi:MAG: hypothetical protein ABIS50_13975 [Luteolibacter sp.]|uniref:hypothetical protein n=1 Tax=Luteolibacter sp. TaxID=1962973 RepID=UPI003263425A